MMRCDPCHGEGYIEGYVVCGECMGSGIASCCDAAGANSGSNEVTLTEAKEKLAQLIALRELFKDKKPGYDQKVRTEVIKIVFGDDERFLEEMIAAAQGAVRWHRVLENDETD